MSSRQTAIVALLLAAFESLPGPVTAEPSSLVIHPGRVLVDVDTRRAAISNWPRAERDRLCPPAEGAAPGPIAGVGVLTRSAETQATYQFAHWVASHAGAWLAGQNPSILEQGVAAIHAWAAVDALAQEPVVPTVRPATRIYPVRKALATLVPSWAILRTGLASSDRRRQDIDTWLDRRVRQVDRNTRTSGLAKPCRTNPGFPDVGDSDCNNHRYLRDAVVMMQAAAIGDERAFARGLARFRTALEQMRPDGSLPYETMRGARALWYQSHAIASLTLIARTAATQGQDLFSMRLRGRSLDLAVRFLSRAMADQVLVWPYADRDLKSRSLRSARDQDLSFLTRRGSQHPLAWTEAWWSHSADVDQAIDRLMPARRRMADRPLFDLLVGGNATCLWARLNSSN